MKAKKTKKLRETAPDRIYLVIGDDTPDDVDFNECSEISWATEKLTSKSIEYVKVRKDRDNEYVTCDGCINDKGCIACVDHNLKQTDGGEWNGFIQGFDSVDEYYDGFAKVELNEKYNFIDDKCKLLSNQWFDYAYKFNSGYAPVRLGKNWNFIGTNGKYLSKQWFDSVRNIEGYYGCGRISKKGKFNWINKKGKLISKQWFDAGFWFQDGFAKVVVNKRYNFINTDGKLLSDTWFDYAEHFYQGSARVDLGDKIGFIYENGETELHTSQEWDKIYRLRWFLKIFHWKKH